MQDLMRGRRRLRDVLSVLALVSACGSDELVAMPAANDPSLTPTPSTPTPCGAASSTFEAIQRSIFEAHGCTAQQCHAGATPQGGLALTAGVAYESLVNATATAISAPRPLLRVLPGSTERSLLFRKLSALTLGEPLPDGAGAAMPTGGAAPLPAPKLEALALWILGGAPREGVVLGTERLLDCELPEATPLKSDPLEPPPPAIGLQFRTPGWPLAAGGEDEVCFATYYDLRASAPPSAFMECPPELQNASGRCLAYHNLQLIQDPQSHHSNIYSYLGDADASHPGWGAWSCAGGVLAGTACDPTRLGVSALEGGADCGERASCASAVRSAPGCIGWGPPDAVTKRRLLSGAQTARADFLPADGAYGALPERGFIIWNSHGFNLTRAPTTIAQYLNVYFAEPSGRRHLHQSIFDDDDLFSVDVPPFAQVERCRTFTLPRGSRLQVLVGHMHKRGKLFRIWDPPQRACRAADPGCVASDGEPVSVSRRYDDQAVLLYDPPRVFDGESDAERTLLYCARYDNGASNPSEVKRRSTSPPVPGGLAPGGPCKDEEVVCLGGDAQGTPCGGDDARCPGGGSCDACPVRGGVTTEDEMLLLLGRYHVVE